ncbi:MAG: hypothetical protein AAFQ99_05825 [Pseudomonadota bacterium]
MTATVATGKGTKIFVAGLPDGVETEPVAATLTHQAAGATSKSSSATTITLETALPAGFFAAAGNYLSFVDPLTGNEVLVQLAQDASATDTDLNVTRVPEDIAINSTAEYPLRLRNRTTANLDRTGNRETFVTFDDDKFEKGLTTSIANGIDFDGFWSPLDAGYATMEHWFNEGFDQIYIILETRNPKPTAFTKGKIYKGPGSITSMPLPIEASSLTQGQIQAAFNGKPTIVEPELTA